MYRNKNISFEKPFISSFLHVISIRITNFLTCQVRQYIHVYYISVYMIYNVNGFFFKLSLRRVHWHSSSRIQMRVLG